MSSYEEIVSREQKYLLNTYARYPVAMVRGKGVYLWDVDGQRYLDFLSGLGVNALGHAHPRIVKTIREQAARVIHLSNLYYNEYQGVLAEKLCQKSGLDRAFFSNSGTEAIEGALKLARAAGHATGGPGRTWSLRSTILSTDVPWARSPSPASRNTVTGFEPMLEGVRFVAAQRRRRTACRDGRHGMRHHRRADSGRRRNPGFVNRISPGLSRSR